MRIGEASHPGPTDATALDDSSDSDVPVSPLKVARLEACESVAARMRCSGQASVPHEGSQHSIGFDAQFPATAVDDSWS
eukprot:11863256-Karenia_brevis.AAC.1